MNQLDLGKYAQWYVRRGLAVLPLATIDDDRCSCGKADCTSPGKHPIGELAPHGCLDATVDEHIICQWWALYPDANIGIATGSASGIVVVDIDEDHDGWQTIENLTQRHGELPPTWMAATGGGGGHLYFELPACEIRNSAGLLGPGIDIRGQNGYVVAPPSVHISGTPYRWVDDSHPKTTAIASLPEWLFVRIAGSSRFDGSRNAAPLPERLSAGMRNSWLTSAAGTMRRRGFSAEAINAALQVENKERCDPPLGTKEVERIAASIERYSPVREPSLIVRNHA